jgi:hypothetical protein
MPLPAAWTLTASAFNWTPELIRAEQTATQLAARIATDGVADTIEVEAGQLWRSFPDPDADETARIRDALQEAGASVSIVGASIDDWRNATSRRDEEERLAFLVPQLRAAADVGATGVRLPIGQAGVTLLTRLQPHLHDLDLVLFEEVQGQQDPHREPYARAFADLAGLDDSRIRVLLDISMLMPSLPPTYLAQLRAGGVPDALLVRLETQWRDEDTMGDVGGLLRSGGVPERIQTLFMNLLIRFGRSDASELRSILPLVSGVHLKFWDLDDEGGRVSGPIRDIAAELARVGFEGTLCSEWGGHEWLDDDAAAMTRRHLALARTALAEGVASSDAANPVVA